MIKLLLKLAAALLLLALIIVAFIKLLPWCIAIVALVALAKFAHDWLRRHSITLFTWWPCWNKPPGQPGSVPQ